MIALIRLAVLLQTAQLQPLYSCKTTTKYSIATDPAISDCSREWLRFESWSSYSLLYSTDAPKRPVCCCPGLTRYITRDGVVVSCSVLICGHVQSCLRDTCSAFDYFPFPSFLFFFQLCLLWCAATATPHSSAAHGHHHTCLAPSNAAFDHSPRA